MQTLKTAVVVVLLLVVFYGVYEMLNRPPDAPPADVAQLEDMPFDPPEVQFGEAARDPAAEPTVSVPPVTPNGAGRIAGPGRHDGPGRTRRTASSGFPAAGPPESADGHQPPTEPEYPLTVEPPSRAGARRVALGRGQAGCTAAVGRAEPARRRKWPTRGLQQNPFVHENVVVRPSGMADGAGGDQIGVRARTNAQKIAKTLLDEGKYRDALATLSVFYQSPDLTPAEHRELLDLLDPLAGRVVYSREHLDRSRPTSCAATRRWRTSPSSTTCPWNCCRRSTGSRRPTCWCPAPS